MDVLSPRELLRRHGLRPRKGLGQNYLADPVHLDRIVDAGELTAQDVVLEVGPGLGTLTMRLAAKAGHVVAVELDRQLLPVLQEVLAPFANVTVVQGDILTMDPCRLVARSQVAPSPPSASPDPDPSPTSQPANQPPTQPPNHSASQPVVHPFNPVAIQPVAHAPYKVVANVPYYITSPLIRHLLTAACPPQVAVLTVQREVAQRVVARPPAMSLLAVSVQFYARAEVVASVPAGAFYPVPKVDSAVLRMWPGQQAPLEVPDVDQFFRIVRAGFGQRRKQLRNALAGGLQISRQEAERLLAVAGIDPQRRAETLVLEEWAGLARAFPS